MFILPDVIDIFFRIQTCFTDIDKTVRDKSENITNNIALHSKEKYVTANKMEDNKSIS